jgi:hypothetical protein
LRTHDQIAADAEQRSAFSNHTEYDLWADGPGGCYTCANDDGDTKWCPILSAALAGAWPKEWTRRTHTWQIGDASGSCEVVDECTEYEERPDDDGGGGTEPEPEPPPVIAGQVDMFEVFADQVVDALPTREVAHA